MKKYLYLILNCLIISANAQVPQGIPYQAVARNGQGQPLASTNVKVRFSVLDSIATGTAVYVESHSTATSALGLFSANVGMGTASTGAFSSINWGQNYKFLKVELDTTATGNSYIDLGTQQMMSVPYALYAKSAETTLGIGSISNGFLHYIGEEFGGGIVFYLWKDSQGLEHGLIVDKTDLSTYESWSNVQTYIGQSAESFWDGLSNSIAIVSQTGHLNSAAALCLNSINNGKSDWYLPSLDELSLLWQNRFNVNKAFSAISGATVMVYSYWGSTEYTGAACYFDFSYGYSGYYGKVIPLSVRAIRSF